MDALNALKAEMERKRKAAEEVGLSKEKKYVKRSDIEAVRERKYWEEQEKLQERKQKSPPPSSQSLTGNGGSSSSGLRGLSPSPPPQELQKEKLVTISAKEVTKRLRKRGEPIRLFGETEEMRLDRLRKLEEMASDGMEGQVNDFMKNISQLDRELDVETLKRKAEASREKGEEAKKPKEEAPLLIIPITLELFKRSKDRVQAAIHDYFKQLLRDWEEFLDSRTDDEKRTRKGKSDTAIFQQSEDYLQPFFDLLQKRKLPDDILENIVKICECMQNRNYVEASDVYCLLSIGNAPWPIGVTMVGIHERSAREKISSNQVAHVLNDEKTRKWIQSMKRLMTFCQRKYPPEDLAKAIGWTKE